jgi:tetratricopeptide (TPR) repeat protein
MAKKIKTGRKQNRRKLQKQRKRQSKLAAAKQTTLHPNVEDRVDDALKLLEEGNRKEGTRLLERLKRKHGNHSHVHYGLGILAVFGGRHDEAIHFFKKAAQISPGFVEAQYNLGVTYQKQLRIPEMIMAYQQVVKIGEPDSYVVHQAQNVLNRIDEKIQDGDKIGVDEYLRAYRIFEQGVEHMQSKNWEAAIAAFTNAIEINPNNTQPYGNLGICYASLGKKQLALDALDRAIELDPDYEPALINRNIVASLKEGESLELEVKTIEYYKDYSLENRSYIKEYLESQGLLTEKGELDRDRE